MGIYGVDFYGTSLYGAPLFLSFDARPFTAEPVGYGALRLKWVNPKIDWIWNTEGPGDGEWIKGPDGDWSDLRVVRSSYGFPKFPEDGVTILEKGNEAESTFIDRDVREGQFYYYSIFVLETENDLWIRAGDTIGLPTKDHEYSEELFGLMPQFMRQADLERQAFEGDTGPLASYLSVLGASIDHIRTEYETLRCLRDPEKISGNLIWPLADMFGIPFEPAIGMRQARVWLRDSVYLYRIKGTRPGVEAAASAMTGWGARVTRGKNLLRSEGAHGWYSDGTIADSSAPDNPQTRTLTVSHTSAWTMSTAPIGTTAPLERWFGIPVEELTDYSFSTEIRPAASTPAGRDFQWTTDWYDIDGAFLSTSAGTAVASVADAWVDVDSTFNSPAGSAYAVVNFEELGAGGTETFVKRMQMEKNLNPTSWEPARAIVINFDPVRWNFLPNPSFRNGLFGWTATSGTASTDEGDIGPATGGNHAVLDGSMESILVGISTAGVSHVFSVYALEGTEVTLRLEYFVDPEDENPVTVFEGSSGVDASSLTRASVFGVGPPEASFVRVSVSTVGAVRLGSTMLEEGSIPGDYFDGDFFGADYLWAGSAGVSASKYYPARAERNVRVQELIVDYLPIGQPFLINYIGGAPASGVLVTGDEGTMGFGTYGIMPFGQ